MNKLPISIGILAWRSGQTLVDTLETYVNNGLFDIVQDVTILFQEVSDQDHEIAQHFGIPFLGEQNNIGIGMGLLKLAQTCVQKNILLLEHDWKLIENKETTYKRLLDGVDLLDDNYDCVRYRHRKNPGFPHFSIQKYQGKELEYYDDYYKMKYPHLLDSIHWKEHPDKDFPEFIQKDGDHYISTSRVGNWTNNPCMYKKKFYVDITKPFINNGHIVSEGDIAVWWANQTYMVAHGEGLFFHQDRSKYGDNIQPIILK